MSAVSSQILFLSFRQKLTGDCRVRTFGAAALGNEARVCHSEDRELLLGGYFNAFDGFKDACRKFRCDSKHGKISWKFSLLK